MYTPEIHSPANGFTPLHWSAVDGGYKQRSVVMNQQRKGKQKEDCKQVSMYVDHAWLQIF